MIWIIFAVVLPTLVCGWYRPHIGTRFQIQLSVESDHPFDYHTPADLYETDMWGITEDQIHAIHAKGAHVVCYFSAGTYDRNRPDHNLFRSADLGKKMANWDEYYLNINSHNVRSIMAKRMDYARNKGCDAVDPDNVDGWQNPNNGIGYTKADQIVYNKFLAEAAHARNLGIALKNSGYLVNELHSNFDWVVDESCHEWGQQCYMYQPFLDQGKPVFNIEYVSSSHVSSSNLTKCSSHHPHGLQTQFKLQSLNAWVQHCSGQ